MLKINEIIDVISSDDYTHAENVWQTFRLKLLRHYSDLYGFICQSSRSYAKANKKYMMGKDRCVHANRNI